MSEIVEHTLEPIFDDRSRVLILGTMPSPASREQGFYYGHPQNRFWRVMERLFNLEQKTLVANDARRAFLLREHIALWDVLASCQIDGASDASIRNARPNDLMRVIGRAPIACIFTTGQKAAQLYRRLCQAQTHRDTIALPSTSPANAAKSLDDLVDAYRVVVDALRQP